MEVVADGLLGEHWQTVLRRTQRPGLSTGEEEYFPPWYIPIEGPQLAGGCGIFLLRGCDWLVYLKAERTNVCRARTLRGELPSAAVLDGAELVGKGDSADVKDYDVDVKGWVADVKGCVVDGKGCAADGKGYDADGKGYDADGKGYDVDGKGCVADGKGYDADGKGYAVDGKGYAVDDPMMRSIALNIRGVDPGCTYLLR
eukprot:1177197-Prorocentrum_minimum.AAC.2